MRKTTRPGGGSEKGRISGFVGNKACMDKIDEDSCVFGWTMRSKVLTMHATRRCPQCVVRASRRCGRSGDES